MFLRLDVDHACFNKYWSYFRLATGLPIPNFLDHVKIVKRFLEENYPEIPRIWMFRPRTCPDRWDEKFGLHSQGFDKFPSEYKILKRKLGEFKFFNTHGFAPIASGRIWRKEEIEIIERKYKLVNLSNFPHVSIDLEPHLLGEIHRFNHVNFHPCHFYTHYKIFVKALDLMKEIVKGRSELI